MPGYTSPVTATVGNTMVADPAGFAPDPTYEIKYYPETIFERKKKNDPNPTFKKISDFT